MRKMDYDSGHGGARHPSGAAADEAVWSVLDGRRILLVSPHYSDAILSASALVQQPRPVDVATVFTRASDRDARHDRHRHGGVASVKEALGKRDREDTLAYVGTAHRRLKAGLAAQPADSHMPRSPEEAVALRHWLDGWLAEDPGEPLMFLPAAAGRPLPDPDGPLVARAARLGRRIIHRLGRGLGLASQQKGPFVHPDHQWVRDILTAHAITREIPLGYYEEFPQLIGAPADATLRELARRRRLRLRPIEAAVDLDDKGRRISAYSGQIPLLRRHEPRPTEATGQRAVERYWLPAL